MNNLPNFSDKGYQTIQILGHNQEEGRSTYLATDDRNQKVVIKAFSLEKGIKTYDRLWENLKKIDNPHILEYRQPFQASDRFCLVQEYKEGRTFAKYPHFASEKIKQVILSALNILDYLHSTFPKLNYWKIKPENFLIEETGNNGPHACLVDFSFAPLLLDKEETAKSRASEIPGFIPPEKLYNREITPASDLYCLGATLICWLTDTHWTKIASLIDDDYQWNFQNKLLRFREPFVCYNPAFITWLETMVSPNLKKRYSNAQAAIKALEAIQVVGSRTPKRLPMVIGAIALGIVGGTAGAFWHNQQNCLARLLETKEAPNYCILWNANLAGENLENVNLEGANLWNANLQNAKLTGANLKNAQLAGANLRGANLEQANLENANLEGADLKKANLKNANLKKAEMKLAQIEEAKLEGADLRGAKIHSNTKIGEKWRQVYQMLDLGVKGSNSDRDGSRKDFQGVNLQEADLQGGKFSGSDFRNANLKGAKLQNADLRGAQLQGANLGNAKLKEANLEGANLTKANLYGAYLKDTKINKATQLEGKWRSVWQIVNEGAEGRNLRNRDLKGGNFKGANFKSADLRGADLQDANFINADLRNANLRGANLKNATLKNAKIQDANLKDAKLEGVKLEGAKINDFTQLDRKWRQVWGIVNRTAKLSELKGLDLEGANLEGAILQGANLEGANLEDAKLKKAKLAGANLRGANLEFANLQEADLQGADLQDANLKGAIMPDGSKHE